MELKGKVAIVTGGSLGIGRAIALDLAAHGADIAINYRKHADEANQVVCEAERMGRRGLAVQADVASFGDALRMVDAVRQKLGRLDILVNNAGINRDAVVWKMSESDWDAVLSVNLKGCFNYARAAGAERRAPRLPRCHRRSWRRPTGRWRRPGRRHVIAGW